MTSAFSFALGAVLGIAVAVGVALWRGRRRTRPSQDDATPGSGAMAVPLELHAVLNALGRCTVAAPTDVSLHDGMEHLANYLMHCTPRPSASPRLREVVESYWALAQWLHLQSCPISWSGADTPGPQAAQAAALVEAMKTLDPAAVTGVHVSLHPAEAVLQCALRDPRRIDRFGPPWTADAQGRMVRVLRLPR